MIFQYDLQIDTPTAIPPKYRYIFKRAIVPYSRTKLRFDSRKVSVERDVQELLKKCPKIRAKLSVFDFQALG